MDYENLSPGNRHGLKERLDLLQVRVCEILGEKWRVEKVPGRRRVLHLVCDPGNVVDDEANDAWLNACAVLWDYRKSGVSLRSLEYSRSHSMWRCPLGELMRVKRQLSCPAVQEFVITPHGGGHDILWAKCNLLQKVQLMRARAPPHVPKQVLAGGAASATTVRRRHQHLERRVPALHHRGLGGRVAIRFVGLGAWAGEKERAPGNGCG